jgi:GT2 family glycosyltransferase
VSYTKTEPGWAPRLAVVVGTYNRLDQVRRCVDSIRRETSTATVIYVTDAGSTDGTVDYLRSAAAPDLVPILVDRKLGQAKAYNDVFKSITAPFTAWLSDDNEIVNAGLDRAVAILEREPRIGMVGLKVRDKQGPFVRAPYIGGISKAGVLNVNQGVLRTRVLRKAGYFSETFGFYGIDPDLTAKVLFLGCDVVYTRAVAIHHYRNWPTDLAAPDWQALQHHHRKADLLYAAKYLRFARHDLIWQMRRASWKLAREALGRRFQINSSREVAGLLQRDWHNVFAARHISLLDPLLSAGKAYHLRQSLSPLARPSRLPADPDPERVLAEAPV